MALIKNLKQRLNKLEGLGFSPAMLREAQRRNFTTEEWPPDPRLRDLIAFVRRFLIAAEIATVGSLNLNGLGFVPTPEELAEVGYDPKAVNSDAEKCGDPADE